MECMKCGTCCIALDISTLKKPINTPCRHLGDNFQCTIYENRPAVCREYSPWEACVEAYDPDINVRVKKYLKFFDIDI